MSWLDKIAKKRLAELEEHPELNEQNYSQKLNSIIFYIGSSSINVGRFI